VETGEKVVRRCALLIKIRSRTGLSKVRFFVIRANVRVQGGILRVVIRERERERERGEGERGS
jgi:hypothetical protein